MKKRVIKISAETMDFVNEALLDILKNLDKMINCQKNLIKKLDASHERWLERQRRAALRA